MTPENTDAETWKMAFEVALDLMTQEQIERFMRLWALEFEPLGASLPRQEGMDA